MEKDTLECPLGMELWVVVVFCTVVLKASPVISLKQNGGQFDIIVSKATVYKKFSGIARIQLKFCCCECTDKNKFYLFWPSGGHCPCPPPPPPRHTTRPYPPKNNNTEVFQKLHWRVRPSRWLVFPGSLNKFSQNIDPPLKSVPRTTS